MTDAAQPLVVVTDWGARGAALLAILLAAVAAAALLYRRAIMRSPPPRIAVTIAGAAAGLLLAAFSPVIFSSDVYAYAAYGDLARLGADPYARTALSLDAPLVRAAAWQWGGALPICVYGPAFVELAKTIVSILAPLGVPAQLNGFRLVAAAAFLLCGPLALAAYRGSVEVRLRAAAALLLNPAAIWCAAEGHNDALALAVVLSGFALVRRHWAGVGAAVAALAALVKLPGMAAAAALAVVDRRARLGAAIGAAVVAALSIPLVTGVATQLAPHGRYAPQASLQALFAPLSPALAVAAAVAVAIVLAVAGLRRLKNRAVEGWIWLGIGAWVLVPNPYPWYGLWLVAIAATAPQSRAGRAAVLLSLTALLRYAPDAIATPSPALQAALGLLATLPLAALL